MTGAESEVYVQSRCGLLISIKNDFIHWVSSQLGNMNNLFQNTIHITESMNYWFTSIIFL